MFTLGAVLLTPGIAHSQSEPAAKALFDEAEKLMDEAGQAMMEGLAGGAIPLSIDACKQRKGAEDAGCAAAARKFRKACSQLRASVEMKPTPERLFRLPVCYDMINKLASARAAFAEAQPQLTGNELGWANDRLKDLLPRIPSLIVHPPDGAHRPPAMKVILLRQGDDEHGETSISSALWGAKVPVDGGTYTIKVQAEGHEPWETTLRIDNDATGKPPWEVTIPPLKRSPAGSSPTGTGQIPPPPSGPAWHAPLGWTSLAIGAAGIGLGAIAGGIAISQWGAAQSRCEVVPDICPPDAGSLSNEAGTWADVSTGGFVVGGIGVASAVVWLVIAPRTSSSAAAKPLLVAPVMLVPAGGPGYAGATAIGRF